MEELFFMIELFTLKLMTLLHKIIDLLKTVCKKGFITDGSSQVMNPFFSL